LGSFPLKIFLSPLTRPWDFELFFWGVFFFQWIIWSRFEWLVHKSDWISS